MKFARMPPAIMAAMALCTAAFAAWGDAAYVAKQNLIYDSVDASPLGTEPRKVMLRFDQKRDSEEYFLVVQYQGTKERSKPSEMVAFTEAVAVIAERLTTKLKDHISAVPKTDIKVSEIEVCVALMWTRYDRVAVIPLRFTK